MIINNENNVLIDIKKLIKTLGIILVFIGASWGVFGIVLISIGNTAKIRYNEPAGKFLRNISPQDSKYYSQVKILYATGRVILFISVVIIIVGIFFVFKSKNIIRILLFFNRA